MIWTKNALQHRPHRIAGNRKHIDWIAPRLGDGLLVDIGAQVGTVCIGTLLDCPGARAVAFEPQIAVANILQEMIEANGVPVELHRVAMGAEPGEAVLSVPHKVKKSGWATVAERPDFQIGERYAVPVTSLDAWWEEAGRPEVRVVKCDTQGKEVDILDGGQELLATVPYLMIEFHGPTLAEHGRTKQNELDRLEALGYEWAKLGRDDLMCERR
jgi:FkbM family methyltransferase